MNRCALPNGVPTLVFSGLSRVVILEFRAHCVNVLDKCINRTLSRVSCPPIRWSKSGQWK